ncbi:hypothetical protein [Corynebacterium pelargi]|uniref:Uncharacterized protein n=1 Tax=Corynebacterium pelargi TaxID=1471400 RepID=A0A410W8C9_9CORY|nr:hypothetical protein [Corynebacterium pelargi]QAU52209.1 hypothetical protein CPELA_04650 [Corynebacterium pelargi]GGG69349.1 hypothetical protein GCM10007338_02600 [Corynebacterium pelargi]
MPDQYLPEEPKQQRWLLWALLPICVGLVLVLQTQGLLLAAILVGVSVAGLKFRPDSQEIQSVRASLALSLEDIQRVISEYERFGNSEDAEAVADRTLLRPALADESSTVPEIQHFHETRKTAERFCARVQARLEGNVSVAHLERLLVATDRRAAELQHSWNQARHTARKLSP